MKEVSAAIIGAGFWGRNHARVLKEIPGVFLKHVCDIQLDRAKELASRYNIPYYTQDYREVLRDDVDVVLICTPSSTHGEVALAAVESGKHVLVEKPMATSIRQAESIALEAKNNGCMVMVGFIERFNPALMLGKELLERGEIGNVMLSYSRRIGSWPERVGDIGVVKDTAIHDIDLAMYLFKEEPISVFARGGSIRHSFEDHTQAVMTFERNKSALLEANWLTPRKKREMHITGDDGVLSIQFLTKELTIEKADGLRSPTVKQEEPLMLELKHFIESVRRNEDPSVTCIDGLKSVVVAEAILESMREGKVIYMDDFCSRELTASLFEV